MSHIFISYSRSDKAYVLKLKDALENAGLPVWIDEHIDYGDRWTMVIEENIIKCASFIVVMTPRSSASTWVERELGFAQDIGKPVFPMLLEGNVWLVVREKQYVDVRNGMLPPRNFFDRLGEVVPTVETQIKVSTEKPTTLTEELDQLRNLIEQGEITSGLLKLRNIIKTKLDKIAKDHGLGGTEEPPMHTLRLLAKNQIIAAKAQMSLEYALSVASKSLHEIEVDQKEATEALTKADEGLNIIELEDRLLAARTRQGKFVIKMAVDQGYYFSLKAANGKILLTSDFYFHPMSLRHAIETVKKNATEDAAYHRKRAKNGKHYFELRAKNFQVMGVSNYYSSTNTMENAIVLVKKIAPPAQMVDEVTDE